MSGALVGSGSPPSIRVGARNHCMHSMYLAGVPLLCIHVPATNPLCAGRHPDLVTRAVVTDHRSRGVRAVSLVVARERRIVPARITDTVMNRVVPVVIVIGVYAVPATVMRLKRVMRPANAGVCAGYDNVLPGKTQAPIPVAHACN